MVPMNGVFEILMKNCREFITKRALRRNGLDFHTKSQVQMLDMKIQTTRNRKPFETRAISQSLLQWISVLLLLVFATLSQKSLNRHA
jgi:hypothetical protein